MEVGVKLAEAASIVQALANGIDPGSGDRLHSETPFNQPKVIRALYTLLLALKPRLEVLEETQDEQATESFLTSVPLDPETAPRIDPEAPTQSNNTIDPNVTELPFDAIEPTDEKIPVVPPDSGASSDRVLLFTDGACSGNPGPGGWAYLLRHPASGLSRDGSGAEYETTNNRMELTGAIKGLEALNEPSVVELVTDSQYVARGLKEWMPRWKSNGWRRKEGRSFKPVVNEDLWRQLDELATRHRVTPRHVLGHNGHPENEAVDGMAVDAIKRLGRS